MIHVVYGDPRVPRPQSEELHMALKKLGVPTEFFVYPGNSHGIPEPRDQYTKAMAEFLCNVREQGLTSALTERDAPFGDYRTTKR